MALAFAIFIIAIIILADLGRLRFIFWIVGRVPYLDKLLHFLLVGVLTFLVSASLMQTLQNKNSNWIAVSCVLFFIITFTIEEISQIPLRRRDFSPQDLIANYLGILVFGFLAWWKYGKAKTIPPSK